jgi:hypothetical protein
MNIQHKEVTSMKHCATLPICVFSITLLCAVVYGQNAVIVQKEVMTSRALSGHVQLGTVSSGLRNVLVEVCGSDWKNSVSSTTTDDDGAFSFPALTRKKTYHLRLSMPGENTLLVRVRLKTSGSRSLIISLTPAT